MKTMGASDGSRTENTNPHRNIKPGEHDMKFIKLTLIVSAPVLISMLTSCGSAVKDADGNVYQTVKIGNQIWMVENLRTTKYNDGTPIPLVTENSEWKDRAAPAYCWYENDEGNKERYGALYNWHTVNTGKLAPEGWHVPTDKEWTALEEYMIENGNNWDGTTKDNKIGKSLAAEADWKASSEAGDIGNDMAPNNSSGFTGLPGGYRAVDGYFVDQSGQGRWWSATEIPGTYAWTRLLYHGYDELRRVDGHRNYGFSVRLVRY